jgi:Tfp pilus assembly protein PilV
MSAELTRARKQLTQVRSLLRQGKVMPAAQSYHTALLAVLKNPLMKAEKEEFERLLDDAAHHLNNDAELRRVFPLTISYKPGAEREVLDVVASLVKALEEAAVSEAQEQLRQFEASKEAEMRRGQQMLDDRQFEDAQKHFRGLVARFEDDAELKKLLNTLRRRWMKAPSRCICTTVSALPCASWASSTWPKSITSRLPSTRGMTRICFLTSAGCMWTGASGTE